MAETFSMRVDGLRELQARLKEFAPKLAAKALGASVNAGAKVIKDDAIARAPYYTGVVQDGHPPPGTLRRSIITVKIPKESNQYKKVYAVTVRTGLKYRFAGNGWKGQDAFYWRFVEFGTSAMTAKPFMRPAFESEKVAAMDKIIDELHFNIEKLAIAR